MGERYDAAVPRYALLTSPAGNRVYAESAADLARAELAVLAGALAGRLGPAEPIQLAGVPYLAFEADDLTDRDLALLGLTSAVYALFEFDGDAPTRLRPVAVPSPDRYTSDLLTILKYQGKTNEQFTRLLLTATILSTAHPERALAGRLSVLDPVCGRGTTLNQAAMFGLDVTGIDLDAKDFELYTGFLTTWLKDHRLKHRAATTPVRREHKVMARKYEAVFAPSKDDYQAGNTQRVTVYRGDTRAAAELVRPGTVDVLVGDLPYGVQHGGTAASGLARSPLELLDDAVQGWAATLRSGGALGLAWNTRVARRSELAERLEAAGLVVCTGGGYEGFVHKVDRVITRDVIIARKP
jgi:hypothetical protein